MKSLYAKLLPLLFLPLLFLVACKESAENVVVAGDSWAFFMCTHKSFDAAFAKAGLSGKAAANSNCELTSMPDIRAENWLKSDTHRMTLLAVQNPQVKVLFLSLGGNDVINHWNKDMSPWDEQNLFLTVERHVTKIVGTFKKLRPDLKILISGYDYPRFTPNLLMPPFRKAFELMGSPTPLEINNSLIRFSKSMSDTAAMNEVSYIHHLGLMHFYFGNTSEQLEAGQTLAPDLISPPEDPKKFGGDPRFQTDEAAMLKVDRIVDAFHLSKFGYGKLADHAVAAYLSDWLQ